MDKQRIGKKRIQFYTILTTASSGVICLFLSQACKSDPPQSSRFKKNPQFFKAR